MTAVLYEKRNRIAYITLNRPEVRNALDETLNQALWAVWDDFAKDDSLDVAILTGSGKAFCAGADLKTFLPKLEKSNMLDVRKNVHTGIGGGITRGQHKITKPIIAAINGCAIGGGFEMALACDFRIASENARFGVFEVRYGLHQGDGGIVRLIAIAGVATALDLTLTGREISAEEAYRLRLVTKVVPQEGLMATAEQYATMIQRNSQQAIRSAKETILDVVGRSLDDALRLEALNGYSSIGDFSEARERLAQFYSEGKHE
ncbi:MAG: enoyl-CoA hydratase-related protein [Desulfobacterales bacterium]|jgi:enoyl-CoA hydratase|nr:enoyl-CoA hydratase-related protein [Desulfobacterales bacterium]